MYPKAIPSVRYYFSKVAVRLQGDSPAICQKNNNIFNKYARNKQQVNG